MKKEKEIKFSTDEELLKKVKRDIRKHIKEEKALPPKTKEEKIFEDMENHFQKEKLKVKHMNSVELAGWLMDKHDSFVETMNWMFKCDFMSCEDFDDRFLKVMYINELCNLMMAFEIDHINEDVVGLLQDNNYVDLIQLLNVLNFC